MLKRVTIIFAVLLLLLIGLPFLIPTSTYLRQAESMATEKLGVPVSLGSAHIAFLPTPRLNISDISVGKNSEISVASVAVVPALGSLFSETRVISSLRVSKPVIKKSALDILAALPKTEPASTATSLTIRRIVVSDARLEWPDLRLPDFNADMTMTATNKPESARIDSTDRKLHVELVPKNGWQEISVKAEKWMLPAGPPLLVDKLDVGMLLRESRLDVNRIDASLYHGKLAGSATLDWAHGWLLNGKFKLDGLSVAEPARLVSQSSRVSGNLFADGGFGSKANEPAKLADVLTANVRFRVENGVLYGLDLAKAATLLLKQGQQGGETKFDQLSGLLDVNGKNYRFSDLKVTSGLIAATGKVNINPKKELDGLLDVELKNSATMAVIPLQVSGTVDKPSVVPTKAALAGAVAGTAVLGPLGTSVGMKAGSALGKLFGGGDKK